MAEIEKRYPSKAISMSRQLVLNYVRKEGSFIEVFYNNGHIELILADEFVVREREKPQEMNRK